MIKNGGNSSLLVHSNYGDVSNKAVKHNIYQWGAIYANGNMAQGGWGGQGLIVNPKHDLVAVFTSYFKDDYSEVGVQAKIFEVLEGVFDLQK